MPTSTARRVRSSSQSIRSSAKVSLPPYTSLSRVRASSSDSAFHSSLGSADERANIQRRTRSALTSRRPENSPMVPSGSTSSRDSQLKRCCVASYARSPTNGFGSVRATACAAPATRSQRAGQSPATPGLRPCCSLRAHQEAETGLDKPRIRPRGPVRHGLLTPGPDHVR